MSMFGSLIIDILKEMIIVAVTAITSGTTREVYKGAANGARGSARAACHHENRLW